MMSISPEQEALIDRVFEAYLTDHHHSDILQLIADTNEETHHPVVVNAMTLFEANMEVGDYFNAYPNDVLAIFNKVLNRKAMGFSNNASTKHVGSQRRHEQQMRRTLHARITGLPVCPELTRDTIPRTRDVGHFLSVTGTVIRTSVAKVLEYERDYMCTKCRHVFTVQADFEQFYTFVSPVACPSPDGCNSYKFSCLSGGSEPAVCRDYQEIKIQEQVQRLSVGSIPRSVVVVLEDDLVDSCKSGDDVTVYGVMCLRWKPFYDGTLCDVELVLKANNIEVNNQQAAAALLVKDAQKEFEDFWNSYKHDPIAGRNQILLSLCPQVFGMYVVKLAVAMVLAGGVQRIDSSGTKIRGECHMLLVGDPGTGKSQFLKYAAKIMSRSVLTAGIGSTSAGLTVAAVKDGGEWHLEAGALVLSDGGLCCIDEFNSIKEHDRISIHEAMEQQSISVAKAGIVCKLNTRTTILAATNPKGQYDPNEPLSVNVALASPLLSRFDLVLVLLDTRNAEWDRIISSFILEDRDLPTEFSSQWSMDKMKAYFSVIKQLQPQVSDEANCILTRYYQLQRQSDGRNAARTTIRMLESLSRLAEAHARLMYRETVTIEDAVIAVSVMECSMQGGALLGNVNALLTSFPADPDRQYQTQCQILLEGLNLPQLLQKEMDRLARLKSRTSKTSECDPPTPKFQHQFSGTNSKTQCSDITGNPKTGVTVKSGSFHTSPSPPSEFRSSSVVTSTQGTWNTKTTSSERAVSMVTKQPSCQNEEDTLRKTDSEVTVSKTTGATFWFDTEPKENLQGARNKNTKEKLSKSQEKIQKCEREKNETHPEASGCVVQSKHQQLHNDCGKGLRERVVSRAESKNVRDDDLVQENLSTHKRSRCVKENKRDQAGANNSSAVFRENMAAAAEADTDLHAKLSGFMFKPKKMRPLVNNHDIISSPEKEMNMEMKAPKLINHDESAFTHTETQNQENFTSDVGESGSKGSTHSTSKASGRNSFSFRKVKVLEGTVGRKNGRDDTDNVRERAGATDDSNTETFLCPTPPKPSSDVTHQTTLKSGHKTTAVTSSTLAKLSRFSFACTGDPTAAQENGFTAAQEKSATDTVAKCKVKQTAFSHGANSSNHVKPDMVGSAQRTASLKRKCFELSPLGSISGGLFSGSSLFASTELNSDVLDTDWDQEVSKRARV